MRYLLHGVLVIGMLAAAGCGGGGGGTVAGGTAPGGPTWTSGVFQTASTFENQCASPRTGTDPFTGTAYPDKKGTLLLENNWLRSWTNELYLWYAEVPDQNPSLFTSTANYFDVLKSSAVTASGSAKDKFHFTYPTSTWKTLSQTNVQAGYGAQFAVLAGTPPREVIVAYTEPNSPAVAPSAALARGTELLQVDGVDVVNANDQASVDKLNAGAFPQASGESHTFVVRDVGASSVRTITMVSADVQTQPVQNVHTISTSMGTVGYILFNDHLATSEQALIAAFNTLKTAAVNDLVLDIRYNSGGYLDIASEVAYMIAGDAATAGQTFEKIEFNDKHPLTDPVTGATIQPVPFHATSQGFSVTAGQALPTLNLPRVFLLTGSDTCSASEAIINGLQGVNVQVIQIGATTCGKPYGFYPQDNCGTTYFSIEFRGVNAQGFGDYTDGFTPVAGSSQGANVPGCSVADDFTHALGDVAESRLATALAYQANPGTCSVAPVVIQKPTLTAMNKSAHPLLFKGPWRSNRVLRR